MCRRTGKFVIIRQGCGPARAVPVDCGDIFCVECEKMRAAQRAAGWLPVIKRMRSPVMLTPTIRDGSDLVERIRYYQASFQKLLDIRLGDRNRPKWLKAAKNFVREHYLKIKNQGKMTETEYFEQLARWDESCEKFDTRIGKINSNPKIKIVQKGKNKGKEYKVYLRLRDIVGPGLALFECTWLEDWHPHRHLILDTRFIPWPYLVVLWMVATDGQGEVIDIRPIEKTEEGMKEVFKYLSKTWEIPEEKRDEFRAAVHGIKRVWPLGGAKPDKVEKECPFCHEKNCHGRLVGMGEDCEIIRAGDIELMRVQVGVGIEHLEIHFQNVQGTWVEKKPEALYLILREIACHNPAGPPVDFGHKWLSGGLQAAEGVAHG